MVRTGILILVASLATAQSGTFTATGSMSLPRVGHTATLLQNGKVLICGGASVQSSKGTVWASAELYDPGTGTFTGTGGMTTPRWFHTATLLPDGRVLITGGTASSNANGSSVLRSAELYDPATGAFSAAGNMTTERMWHAATLLNNGRVLIAGGLGIFIGINNNLSSAELYDPATGIFSLTGRMSIERYGPTAALLPNGEVLIAGGLGYEDGPIHDVELYNPDTGAFSRAGATFVDATGRSVGPAIMSVLPSGKVLVTLNLYDSPTVGAQLYDSSKMTFEATGSLSAQTSFISTLLSTGTVLAAGHAVSAASSSAEVYDPAGGGFSITGDLITPRTGHTATLIADGTVLFSGGVPSYIASSALTSAELYHPVKVAPPPFLYSLAGTSQGAILHAGTNRVVSAGDPAAAGEALEIYGSGLLDGSVIPPQVAIGGRMAEVLFFGDAPGYSGLKQINVRVPAGVAPGPAVPVRLTYIGRSSNEVTIGAQ